MNYLAKEFTISYVVREIKLEILAWFKNVHSQVTERIVLVSLL
ncbi:hypothetical protein WDW89_12215 [Deltaproteobacteria bacterium TL4]